MNSLLLVFCVLLHLVTPGYSVKCIECFNISATYCTGQTIDCGAASCMSGLISLEDYTLFGRACAPAESACEISGSMTSIQRVHLSTSCCKSNNCDPGPPTLPSNFPMKNGVVCHTCTSTDTCNLECAGNESRCASMTMTTQGASVGPRLRGCATDSICRFGNHTFDIENVVYNLEIVCSAPTVSLQRCSLYLTFVLATFMINMF